MRRASLTIGIIFFSFCLSRQVWAFGVAPATIDTSGNRGEVVEQTFTLVNDNNQETFFYFETLKIEAKDESGSPKFIPYNTDHSELPDWITLSTKKLVVPARSFVEVPFSVNIPADVQSKSYSAAITVSDNAPITETTIQTFQTKTAILVFLTVNGENNEQAGLLDLKVSPKWGSQISGSVNFRIQNQGNVYIKPQGTITFKDILGRTLKTISANPDESRVLPGTTRTIEITFSKENFWKELTVGPVTAELSLVYGDSKKTLNKTTTIWIIPWQIILVILGGISFLIGIKKLLKTKKK